MRTRHFLGVIRAVGVYTLRSGRWWLLLVGLVWLLAAFFVATAHVVVPTAVYTLF